MRVTSILIFVLSAVFVTAELFSTPAVLPHRWDSLTQELVSKLSQLSCRMLLLALSLVFVWIGFRWPKPEARSAPDTPPPTDNGDSDPAPDTNSAADKPVDPWGVLDDDDDGEVEDYVEDDDD